MVFKDIVISTQPNIQARPATPFVHNRQQMLNNLVDNLKGMVYCNIYDEHWTMLYISNGCEGLTGYSPDQLIHNQNISYEEVIAPEYRSYVRVEIAKAVETNTSFEIEYPIHHANGSVIWVSERGYPVYDDHGQVQALEGYIQDISDRKNVEASLKKAESRYRSIFENAIEGIFQSTLDGQYLVANPALAAIYGYESSAALISALNNIQHQLYVLPTRRDEFVKEITTKGKVHNFQSQIYRKDKSIIWISENARLVYDKDNQPIYYEGTVEDITELKNHAVEIEYQATHDNLTGLPNRYILNDRLQQSINFASRYNTKLAIVFVDLDQFKLINDSMGHSVGDQLLVSVSKRISNNVRDIDTVVRLGGDEFVILIPNVQTRQDIELSLGRLLNHMSAPLNINDFNFSITCSMGISVYPDDGKDPDTLLKNADSAMFKAKHTGRNNFQFFTPELNEKLTDRFNLEYKLRRAIEHKEFVLHYQPKFNLSTGQISGAEALIRWQPSDYETIYPLTFIQVAEETGLIVKIGQWVLNTACKKAKQLQQITGKAIPIAINVSPKQFRQPNFVEIVQDALILSDLKPELLELEITENIMIEDTPKFIETLQQLKAIGVKLSLDDFGTGYSSLSYLKDFPIDQLKVDRAFVHAIEEDANNMAILKAIIILGQSLGLRVVAEGVETEFQFDFVKSVGCDEVQGYYFSKPLPEVHFDRLIEENLLVS
ncbi:bifunctional diguanylate cyclase/phosphodiesterase [Methylotenera sp. 1P/1]|uniref:bifunctional diguanylate cyclase/phosphodiesterase n=1 Tax=Methylotenera sp. 1P/1 TaxID=1131551 RepID=UPI00037B1570|nr:bifunctional diguanylate cyclase/phosphodiesterase [Methylotenera sp. 1P/1]